MTQQPWRGIHVATALPFNDDLSVDYDAWEQEVVWLAENGMDGVTPNGSLGEYQTLTDTERAKVVQIAVDAVRAARGVHHFLSVTKQGISAIVTTRGNEACHVILRGSGKGPNHEAPEVRAAVERLRAVGLPERLMIDCSHGNSRKKAENQPGVARVVGEQIAGGSRDILGLMIESHLVGGRQDLTRGEPLTRGQSITDACLGWEETVPVLEQLARASRARRATVPR